MTRRRPKPTINAGSYRHTEQLLSRTVSDFVAPLDLLLLSTLYRDLAPEHRDKLEAEVDAFLDSVRDSLTSLRSVITAMASS